MMGSSAVPVLRIGKVLIASFQTALTDRVMEAFQQEILVRIQETGCVGLVIDISGIDMVDTYTARIILRIQKATKLLGTQTILSGVRPEVAATLARLGFVLPEIRSVLDLEEALRVLGVIVKAA